MKKTIQQIELYSGEKWCNMQGFVILLTVLNSLIMAFTISLLLSVNFFYCQKEKKENRLRDS
jgi:hypothetical protein